MTDYERIVSAIRIAKEKGYEIVRGITRCDREDSKCCCALGALSVADPSLPEAGYTAIAEEALGWSYDQAVRFAEGFDGLSNSGGPGPSYALGRRIAQEIAPNRGVL